MNKSNTGDCGTMDKLIEELNAKYSTAGFTPFKHSDVEHPSHYNMCEVETKEGGRCPGENERGFQQS